MKKNEPLSLIVDCIALLVFLMMVYSFKFYTWTLLKKKDYFLTTLIFSTKLAAYLLWIIICYFAYLLIKNRKKERNEKFYKNLHEEQTSLYQSIRNIQF